MKLIHFEFGCIFAYDSPYATTNPDEVTCPVCLNILREQEEDENDRKSNRQISNTGA